MLNNPRRFHPGLDDVLVVWDVVGKKDFIDSTQKVFRAFHQLKFVSALIRSLNLIELPQSLNHLKKRISGESWIDPAV